jgi:hypothetical protein
MPACGREFPATLTNVEWQALTRSLRFHGTKRRGNSRKKLVEAGFAMKNLRVSARAATPRSRVVGFHNIADRVKFWGARGAARGRLWGLFLGGLFMAVPVVGHVAAVVFAFVLDAVRFRLLIVASKQRAKCSLLHSGPGLS